MAPVSASRFYDGQTSSFREVQVGVSGNSLLIFSGTTPVASWKFSDIFVKEDWADGIGAILGYSSIPDASLSIFDKSLFQSLQSKLPRNQQASFLISTRFGTLMALAVLSVGAVWGLFPLVSHLASSLVYLVPSGIEAKLGDVALSSMEDEFKSCDDKGAVEGLNKIIHRLGADLHYAERPEIHLFRTEDVNAFTLPGQKMALLAGFLHEAKSENEIAGVLAHEMGHMEKRDPLEAYIEAQGFGAVASLAGSSGAYGGVTQVASVMQTLKYSREKEFAADAYAVELLHQTGYNSQGLVAFLSRMDSEERSDIDKALSSLEILSTHPETQERIRRIQNLQRQYSDSGHEKASLSPAEFQRLKEACPVTSKKKD